MSWLPYWCHVMDLGSTFQVVKFGSQKMPKISSHGRCCLRHIRGDANCFLGYTLCVWLKPVKLGKPFIVRRRCVHEWWNSGKIEDTWSILIISAYFKPVQGEGENDGRCIWSSTYPTKHMRFSSRLRYTLAHPGGCMLHRSTSTLSSEHIQVLWGTNIANLLRESWGFWVYLSETSQLPVLIAGNRKYEWASVCLLLLACFLEVASANQFSNIHNLFDTFCQCIEVPISSHWDSELCRLPGLRGLLALARGGLRRGHGYEVNWGVSSIGHKVSLLHIVHFVWYCARMCG